MSHSKPTTFDRPRWLVQVRFKGGAEFRYKLSLGELREYIENNLGQNGCAGSKAGIVNKYVFPCVLKRFEDRQVKHIKIKNAKVK